VLLVDLVLVLFGFGLLVVIVLDLVAAEEAAPCVGLEPLRLEVRLDAVEVVADGALDLAHAARGPLDQHTGIDVDDRRRQAAARANRVHTLLRERHRRRRQPRARNKSLDTRPGAAALLLPLLPLLLVRVAGILEGVAKNRTQRLADRVTHPCRHDAPNLLPR
jgi:hypothetical protein